LQQLLLLYTLLGYSITRTLPPRLLGGRFFLNFALQDSQQHIMKHASIISYTLHF
jgi:hypothetical protein